jgi:hypothetical protein
MGVTVAMVINIIIIIMESEYVQQAVGAALALGLAETALRQPNDPIEYLGLWLLKHKENIQEIQEMKSQLIETVCDESTESKNQEQVEEKPALITNEEETQQEVVAPVVTLSRPGSKLSRIEEEETQ